jgi:hypothetical protein
MSDDNHPTLSTIMGILALIVVFYRIIFIGYPMFMEGYNKKKIHIIFKALTTLV